jgi:hypothetical protein
MYGSPIEFCPVSAQWVRVDQSRWECGREHGCKQEPCPLEKQFAHREPMRENAHVRLTD